MTEHDRLVDDWLDHWEDLLDSGQGPSLEEFLASLGSDLPSDLMATFRRRAQALAWIDDHLPGKKAKEEKVVEMSVRTVAGASPASPVKSEQERDAPQDAGRYHIVRPHARGGLGEVFVAHDMDLERDVAIKQIQEGYAGQQSNRARFMREARITARLEHPGIVPVYSMGTYPDGRPYYAMRFIRGISLQGEVARCHEGNGKDFRIHVLHLRQLLGRFHAVCQVIAYAHSRGVLHRDLKPANIMLGEFGETLVVDWGLAKDQSTGDAALKGENPIGRPPPDSEATLPGTAIGTLGYMSPEQCAGEPSCIGPASDIYSLGSTLYAILTGRAPFAGNDPFDVIENVERGRFDPPCKVNSTAPPALEAVCLKAMALRPDARYATCTELAADIERWLADEPVSVWREPFSARFCRWQRRNGPIGAVLASSVLLVALLGVAFSLVLGLSYQREADARQEADLRRREIEKLLEQVTRENEEAGRQRRLAEKERDAAKRERKRAAQGEQAARQTVERLTDGLNLPNTAAIAYKEAVEWATDNLPNIPFKGRVKNQIRDNPELTKWILTRSARLLADQADAHLKLGLEIAAAGDMIGSQRVYGRVIVLLNDATSKYRDARVLQASLTAAYQARATTHESLKQYDLALKDWEQAIKYADADSSAQIGLDWALCMMRKGQLAPALQEAKTWNANVKRKRDEAIKLARLYALASQHDKGRQQAHIRESRGWLAIAIADKLLTRIQVDKLMQTDDELFSLR